MNGLFGQAPDMNTMRMPDQAPIQMPQGMPQGMPQMPSAEMPMMQGSPDQAFEAPAGMQQIPTYIGNPQIDKYIHMFIGAV